MCKIANNKTLNHEAIAASARLIFEESERGDSFLIIKESLTHAFPFAASMSIYESAKVILYNAVYRNLDIICEAEQAKREAKLAESQTPNLF